MNIFVRAVIISSAIINLSSCQQEIVVPQNNTVIDTPGGSVSTNSATVFIPLKGLKRKFHFFGDSITEGVGVSSNDRWSKLVCDSADAIEVNYGINGEIMENISFQGRTVFDMGTIPNKTQDDAYMFISLGVNDVANYDNGFSINGFKNKYAQVIDSAFRKGWDGKSIILLTPYWITNLWASDILQESYRQAVIDLCKEKHLILCDVYQFMKADPNIKNELSDGVHPIKKGHFDIAAFVAKVNCKPE